MRFGEERWGKGKAVGCGRQKGFRGRAGGERRSSASSIWVEPLTVRPKCNTISLRIKMATIKNKFFKKGKKGKEKALVGMWTNWNPYALLMRI